jgi:hypothetical protein
MKARTALEVCKAIAEPFEGDWVALFRDPGRVAALLERVDGLIKPDIQGRVASGVETLGIPERAEGIEGILDIFREWLESFSLYEIQRFEFRELPDGRFLSAAPVRGRTTDPAMEIELEIGTLWTVEDGRLARLEFFMNVADAEEAAGLR